MLTNFGTFSFDARTKSGKNYLLFCRAKTTKISSFFTELFYGNQDVIAFLKHSVEKKNKKNVIARAAAD